MQVGQFGCDRVPCRAFGGGRFEEQTDVVEVVQAGLVEQGRGVSVLAAAPFNSGILARGEPGPDDTFDYAPVTEPVLHRARELAALCRAAGTELAHAAFRFPLRRPEVASVVAGMASADRARLAARRIDEPVPDALWPRLHPAARLPDGAFSRPPWP
ncbi:aldo/keto reductase [Streptomyces olivaceoviridis]|uniref:aldo/keto reductase n=1 Tax=Streptomyces olivaceoviridis TaxID=1921 RepID=UPI0036F7C0EB